MNGSSGVSIIHHLDPKPSVQIDDTDMEKIFNISEGREDQVGKEGASMYETLSHCRKSTPPTLPGSVKGSFSHPTDPLVPSGSGGVRGDIGEEKTKQKGHKR